MSLAWTPRPYHIRGVGKLVNRTGAGLLLDPGMGKTSTALAAFELLRSKGLVKKALVVAPIKPMYGTWPVEAEKWADFNHLTFTILHGKGKEERLQEDTDIYVVNPEGVVWLFGHPVRKLPEFDVLIVDESTKFKNSMSKRFKAIKKHLPRFSYRWILTGTFSPNGLMDLFGQVYIMDQGAALGRYITHYRSTYFDSDGFYTYTPRKGSAEKVAEKIAPMVLKLEAEDYLEMPDFIKVIREVDLPEEAMRAYKEVEKKFITALQSGEIVAATIAAAGTKCRQIANGAVFDGEGKIHPVHEAKIQALEEIVEETEGHPLLILYEFTHDKERIMAFLGSGAVCMTGVSGKEFTNIQDRFNAGSIPYLVAHGSSVHGLNIQGHCYHMVWFCVTWNLENYIQAVWRLYRQGQRSKIVMCYLLVARLTLDERVVRVLDHKQARQDELDNLLINYEVCDDTNRR
jgi:SNF2 family DNA or RNA helicase